MPFPKSFYELIEKGFERNKDRMTQVICRGKDCRAKIQWWTTPRMKQIPLNDADLSPHWPDCPNADDFRRKGRIA